MKDDILDDMFAEESGTEYKYVKLRERFLASLIDSLVLLPITGLMMYNLFMWQSIPLFLLLSIVRVAYKPFLEGTKGATIGKQAMKFKVVDENFNQIEMQHALIRYTPWMVTHILSLIAFWSVLNTGVLTGEFDFMEYSLAIQESPVNTISSIWNFVFTAILLPLIWDKKHQGLHDKFAGTYNVFEK